MSANKTTFADMPDVTDQLMRYIAAEGNQDSARYLREWRLVCHGMNTGYKLNTKRFEQRIQEYMCRPNCTVKAQMMKDEAYEMPMYQLMHNRDWKQLMVMCVKYRMSAQVVHSTLDVFTLRLDTDEGDPSQIPKYASETNSEETTCDDLQACVDLVEGGFFNFVAGIMQAYDRDVAVTQKCVRVLYCMSTVFERISRNITLYENILKLFETHGLRIYTREIMSGYQEIMQNHFHELRPPSSVPADHGGFLLHTVVAQIRNMIRDNADPQLDVVAPLCQKIIGRAASNKEKLKNMTENAIGQAIAATVQWLKMSLESAQCKHNEHQILALRFLNQLLLQNQEEYPRIMLQHGTAEVLVMGIANNNARALALLQGHDLDGWDIMRNQFAFYDLMHSIFSSDLDFTTMVREFCKYSAFEHISETLLLAIDDASVFRFELDLPRSAFYQNVLPEVLAAPYKTRCDGITSAYNIAEMAVVLACKMCQPALHGTTRPIPDAIFGTNLGKFKKLDIEHILLCACRSFLDNDKRLMSETDPCCMDVDCFKQRRTSLTHIHRLAASLRLHPQYLAMSNHRE